jgi:hypothetical protein
MTVLIKHLDLTSLDPTAFTKTVNKYVKLLGLQIDIVISFDRRLKKINGNHIVNKKHIIRMSVCPDGRMEPSALKFGFLTTILHELKHAQQYEEDKQKYNNKKFYSSEQVIDKVLAEWYSQCETEARAFENKHLQSAVAYYDSICC